MNGFIFIDGAGPLPDDPEEFWVTEEDDEDEPADDCACTGKLSRQSRGPLCSNFPCAVSLPCKEDYIKCSFTLTGGLFYAKNMLGRIEFNLRIEQYRSLTPFEDLDLKSFMN